MIYRRNIIFLSSFLLCSMSYALDVQQCLSTQENVKRLTCYDSVLNFKPSETTVLQPAENQPKPLPTISFLIRETGEFDNFAGSEISKNAGKLFIQRENEKSTVVVKSAVLAAFRPMNDLGWQPFVSISLDKNTAEASSKDIRGMHAGITGPLWDAYKSGGTLYSTLRVARYENKVESEKSNSLILHTNIIKNTWVNSPVNATNNFFNIIPQFGFITEGVTTNLISGRRNSAYIGIDASYDLTGLLPRLSISGSHKRFTDISNTVDSQKRNVQHTQISLNYALSDPKNETILFRPYLTISHEAGTDILGGSNKYKKINAIGLKFSYN